MFSLALFETLLSHHFTSSTTPSPFTKLPTPGCNPTYPRSHLLYSQFVSVIPFANVCKSLKYFSFWYHIQTAWAQQTFGTLDRHEKCLNSKLTTQRCGDLWMGRRKFTIYKIHTQKNSHFGRGQRSVAFITRNKMIAKFVNLWRFDQQLSLSTQS